ncbi:hypothetical protein C8R21_11669 [Nitrosospira multiformis]|uniref:Uncharacterized protein n=1 Tax=Nitrosospira multiformis TaxID=1231 RepID=A0A2T5I9E8_9PROT|nr:hypothetical protein C8R21_11669 [Nitrosospira multiformis]
MMKLDEVSELDRVLMEGDQIVSSALQRMEYEAGLSNQKNLFEFGRATSTSLRCDRSRRIARAARPVLIKNAQQEIGG